MVLKRLTCNGRLTEEVMFENHMRFGAMDYKLTAGRSYFYFQDFKFKKPGK